jgi:putative addiction module component (TIGR02574 family)
MGMPRKLEQIETEALKLGARSRAALAQKLLKSLEPATETDNERAWYDEAERRKRELDEGKVDTIPAREVLRRMRSEIGRKRRTG